MYFKLEILKTAVVEDEEEADVRLIQVSVFGTTKNGEDERLSNEGLKN